jgi:hypothetical protein
MLEARVNIMRNSINFTMNSRESNNSITAFQEFKASGKNIEYNLYSQSEDDDYDE